MFSKKEIVFTTKNVQVYLLREDLLHPLISGNKFRKMKYNLVAAKDQNHATLVTFGGAFSNHILATAAAGKEFGFKTIGIIRGEELETKISENPTLKKANELGMKFKFVTRDAYRKKSEPEFIHSLKSEFGDFYLVPEGGTNELAIKGCEEILSDEDQTFDYVCCAIGTGGTISGIINSSAKNQKILGFPSLKGDFISDDIRKFAKKTNWEIMSNYHLGGYGKISDELIRFMNDFYLETNIPLDPIYTGKMMFGIYDLIQKEYFSKGSKILAIHTGGLQGIEGMNMKLAQQNKELIQL